ncbi:tRNA wybutosine-synthesizing protein 3 homolog isoform X1 [Oryzias melastigma]|uniref:tRNA wybutosine-synthesizing protein 3 homolog n=1 Tax=Oryzias melastigma TaxID=30732 RepID=A0A3B3CAM7_ORYME|nr:tRNA wybutosine-synthesizing protein 3 homolog isoform X1 [Oryzias melastigma]
MAVSMETFARWKKTTLRKMDQSRKGSVDERARHVVCLLNSQERFFTTSSCSGRIVLVDGPPEGTIVQKKACEWLFVSHDPCSSEDLVSALSRSSREAVLKFEAFVLHVQCHRLEDAQLLHSVAINSGFRNSGLTVSRTGKIITAVRSTHGLEVPLSHSGKLLVGAEYIHFLTQKANQKMEENFRRMHRFFQNLQAALTAETMDLQGVEDPAVVPGEDDKQTAVYKRRRKRQQHPSDAARDEEDGCSLDDCLDLFS